jgi:hypothetical protein
MPQPPLRTSSAAAARAAQGALGLMALLHAGPAAASPFWDRAHGPPAPRSARLLPAEAWSFGLMQPIEISVVEAELLTTTGTERLRLSNEIVIPDVNVRVGLSDRVELGLTATARAQLRMRLLDEGLNDAPLSVALAAEGGWKSAGLGAQLSRDLWAGDLVLRPTLGIWGAMHEWAASAQVPRSARLEAAPETGLTADPTEVEADTAEADAPAPGQLRVQERLWGLTLPFGVELDVPLNDRSVLVPSVAYTITVPTEGRITATCGECLAGLGALDRRGVGALWVGLRVEGRAPARREAPAPAASPAPSPDPSPAAPATAPPPDPSPAAPAPSAEPDPSPAAPPAEPKDPR